MSGYSEKIIAFIEDHTFIYGVDYVLFDRMNKTEQKKCNLEHTTGLCCVWLPRPFDDIEDDLFASCDKVGVPVIWQGLDEEPTVYIEPVNEIIDIALYDEFSELLREDQVKEKYVPKDLRRVMKQLNKFKKHHDDMSTHLDLDVGDLVKLNSSIVPYAATYPIARIRKISKTNCNLNIDIIHMKVSNGKCICVQNSGGWINIGSIESILNKSHDSNAQYAAYTKEMLLKSRERGKTLKKKRRDRFTRVLSDYLGSKIKMSLIERNFLKNGKGNNPIIVTQEAISDNVDDILIPLIRKKKIEYKKNSVDLKIKIKTPQQLAAIIGSENIMNEKKGYEYFLKYPMDIKYGYKLRYPAFRASFDIAKANKGGNLER